MSEKRETCMFGSYNIQYYKSGLDGALSVIINGYLFSRYKKRGTSLCVRYRCEKCHCCLSLWFSDCGDIVKISKDIIDHTKPLGNAKGHTDESFNVSTKEDIYNVLKKIITEKPYIVPSILIREEPIKQFTLSFNQVKYLREKVFEELKIERNPEDLVRTKNNLLLGCSDGFNILVFGDVNGLQMLSKTKLIQCDGTFSCFLNGSTQLYTFHSNFGDKSVPSLFCMLKRKNLLTYCELIKLIEKIANKHGFVIFERDVFVQSDFEVAFINCFNNIGYTGIKNIGCFFHYSQAMMKNLAKRNLKIEYKKGKKMLIERNDKDSLYTGIRRLVCVSLINKSLVDKQLISLIFDQMIDNSSENIKGDIKEFKRYFKGQWSFNKLDIWNFSNSLIRTNNSVESFNSRFCRFEPKFISMQYFLYKLNEEIVENSKSVEEVNLSKRKKLQYSPKEMLQLQQ